MRLAELLDRCLALEERSAAVYRKFAAARPDDAELAQLWEALAADEDEHARSIRDVLRDLGTGEGELTAVEGCEAAFADVAARLRDADALDADATPNRHLAAALDIELSEIEALRRLGLRASRRHEVPDQDHSHVRRLADTARRRSQDGHVRLAAALLLARERLATTGGASDSWRKP